MYATCGIRQTHMYSKGKQFTFSPMRGSTSLMTGLVALAKALILARSVMILTGRNLAVATIAQFQKAAAHMSWTPSDILLSV